MTELQSGSTHLTRSEALSLLHAEFDRALQAFLCGESSVMAFCEAHGRAYFSHLMAHGQGGAIDSVALRRRGDVDLALHFEIIEQIVSMVCSDEESLQVEFIRCGRIGATEAARRVREKAQASTLSSTP